MHTKFWLENLKGRDYFRDLSTDERIVLKWTLVIRCEHLNWIERTHVWYIGGLLC